MSRLIDRALHDLRCAARTLHRNRAVSTTIVLVLGLGIAASTAVFSAINGVLFRPLPFRDAERLVMLWENDSREGNPRNPVAPANFSDWRTQNDVCDELAYFNPPEGINMTGAGEPERLVGMGVSPNLFSVLGVAPVAGRTFIIKNLKPGAGIEVVVSYALWRRRFGGTADVLGRSLTLDGVSFTVVGIMPQHFQLPEHAEVWWPNFNGELSSMRGRHMLRVIGRLRTGVTMDQARSNLSLIAGQSS